MARDLTPSPAQVAELAASAAAWHDALWRIAVGETPPDPSVPRSAHYRAIALEALGEVAP